MRLSFNSNPLGYPGGAPGFDPGHIAAQGISGTQGASFIPAGTSYLDIVTGKHLSLSGTLAQVMNGYIGPGFTSAGYYDASFLATNTSPGRTWAMICFFTNYLNSNLFLDSSSQANGIY